jgi:hypothetical protein
MTMKLQSNTLVVAATGERAQTYLVKEGRLQEHKEWLPLGLDEEGPSGKYHHRCPSVILMKRHSPNKSLGVFTL